MNGEHAHRLVNGEHAHRLVNGEHAHRLERIEQRVDELHDKIDELAENEAANATDIVWLKWAGRGWWRAP